MTEIMELKKIEVNDLPVIEKFEMDNFYKGIYKNLYLEMGYLNRLYLFSPNYAVLSPSNYPEEIEDFLSRKSDLLDYLKLLLVKNLIYYSFLAEANSYYIEENNHVVIARLREKNGREHKFEIKYYTNSPDDIISNYEDKIYIGRDFVMLSKFKRDFCGLEDHIKSVPFEITALKERFNEKIKNKDKTMIDYFQDIEESSSLFVKEGKELLSKIPPDFSPKACKDIKELKEFADSVRSMKHYLLEIRSALDEFATYLREKDEVGFVKYTVKFRRDIINLINFINYKLLSKTVESISEKNKI